MRNFIANCVFILVLILQGCASAPSSSYGEVTYVENLNQIMAMSNNKKNNTRRGKGPSKIREAALKEAALSLGAQAGLAARAKKIDDQLVRHTRMLDHIFDFNALVLEHNVLPPVLLEGRNTLNLADLQTIRVSNRTFRVSKQAHFITTVPNWRQYLWMDYQPPELPHQSMLPINKTEKVIWQHYASQGWEKGMEQANTILEESIARIKQDYNGMILYRKLLAMNMVSPPFVSHTELGVTGDGEEIHIDDRVLRITALPALNTNAQEWHAAVEKDEEALSKFRRLEQKVNTAKITISSNTWQPINSSVKVYDPDPNPR
jgi:defect-in-organelle-trafficking protein DotC